MHLRSEWTTRVPNWTPARRGVPNVFIHHEGGGVRGIPANKGAVLRQIEASVLPKGYVAIDYSIMVFNDGDIWEGRGLAHEDGATINNNPTSVSVCAVGNYEREPASNALVSGIAEAVRYAAAQGWTVPKPIVKPHRAVFATACPGANLFARMDDIRTQVASGVPKPPPEDEMPVRLIKDAHGPRIAIGDGIRARLVKGPDEANRLVAYRPTLLTDPNLPALLVETAEFDAMLAR